MSRNWTWKLITLGVLTAALLSLPGPVRVAGAAHAEKAKPNNLLKVLKTGALATFEVSGEKFRVWVTNPQTIQQLKDLKAGKSTAAIPNGRILRGAGKAGYNKPWKWHLDPQDVQMAEVTTEVCDGRPSYVNAHLGDFVDTVKRYCPWSAKLVSLQVIATAPTAPANLRVTGISSAPTNARETKVALAWEDRSSNETGFRVTATFTHFYGGGGTQTWEVKRNARTASVSFIAGGFNPLSKVCFTVTALNGAAESSPSNQVCITL